MDQAIWERLTPEEKRRQLYDSQVTVLKQFRERNAISEEQYQKSLYDLSTKMGYQEQIPELSLRVSEGET